MRGGVDGGPQQACAATGRSLNCFIAGCCDTIFWKHFYDEVFIRVCCQQGQMLGLGLNQMSTSLFCDICLYLQFGKVDEGHFVLDFFDLTPFQAFCVALAAFDQ